MGNTIDGECTFEDRRCTRVRITLRMDHNTRPAKSIARIWYDSGSIESQPLRGEMGGDDIAVVGFYGFSEKGVCAGKNCLTVGGGGEVVDACSGVDEVVVRSQMKVERFSKGRQGETERV